MGKFQDMGKLLKLRSEAKSVEKKLKNIHIEADEGEITITISAKQEVIKVDIRSERIEATLKTKLEKDLMIGFNKAMKKSQEIAAENMKDIISQMGGIPGMTQ